MNNARNHQKLMKAMHKKRVDQSAAVVQGSAKKANSGYTVKPLPTSNKQ